MSFRESGHLPKHNPEHQPPDPAGLPRQRRGITPQLHGRYPDYDVLANAGHWDEVTRKVVESRVTDVPPRRFFDREQFACLCAFCDVVLAQDADPRIPVMSFVDAKLYEGRLDGFQHVTMPDDRETWKLVAKGLDEAAGGRFATADETRRRQIVEALADGKLLDDLPEAWSVVMRAVLGAYYSHPWAWNEIGFGGPAYPRGYMRLSGAEPDEGREAFAMDPVRDVKERGMP